MILKKVEIRNIKAVEALDFEAGACTVLAGKNEAGKTTVLGAVVHALSGGHDPAMIRGWNTGNPKEPGIIRLTFDNGSVIEKQITVKGFKLTGKTKEGGSLEPVQTYLNKLTAAISYNPGLFVVGDPKDRVEAVRKVMPLTFSGTEVNGASGQEMYPASKVLDLAEVKSLRDGRYESRRDVGVKITDRTGMMKSAESALPESSPDDLSATINSLESRLNALIADGKAAGDALRKDRNAKATVVEEAFHSAKRVVDSEFEAALANLRADRDAKIEAAANERLSATAAIDRDLVSATSEADAKSAAQRAAIQEQIATLRAEQEEYQRTMSLREQVDKARTELQKLAKEREQLDQAVKGLDALIAAKMETLPIPGVEIRQRDKGGPEVFVDGVEWRHVNAAKRCLVAVAIGSLASGELKMVVIDEAERLDADTTEALKNAAKESGLQLLLARVEDGVDLTVRSE